MKTIDERLQNAIAAVLGKPRLTDPVFCLARVYEIEQGDVLPLLGAREVNARGRTKHLEDPGMAVRASVSSGRRTETLADVPPQRPDLPGDTPRCQNDRV